MDECFHTIPAATFGRVAWRREGEKARRPVKSPHGSRGWAGHMHMRVVPVALERPEAWMLI